MASRERTRARTPRTRRTTRGSSRTGSRHRRTTRGSSSRTGTRTRKQNKDHLLVDSSAELVQEFLVISFRDFQQLVDQVLAFQ